jgi:hypothetical protein
MTREKASRKLIVWEKWFDPLGSNINDFEYPGAVGTPDIDEILEDDDDYDNTKINIPGRGLKLIYTSFGVLPITEYSNPDKNFNFWVAHTNFNISKAVQDAIERVEGVESLLIFSRYRFRIGVGKLFDATQVKMDIQQVLNISSSNGLVQNIILDEDIQEKVDALKEVLAKKNKYWAIYVVPNGEISSVISNDTEDESFNKQIELYKQTHNAVGGALYLYSDTK